MSETARNARVRALAKINLCLEILDKRPDGFHNLRTIFQTISIGDVLDISFTPSKRTRIELSSATEIPNNLVVRAAEAVMEAGRIRGEVQFHLKKAIPMGGGLGGGSTDAAAVLLALPVLAGKDLSLEKLIEVGAGLGSDVPFFLIGGTALGLGRGTELYSIPDLRADHVLLATPPVHSSTAEAYRALARTAGYQAERNWCACFSQAAASGADWAAFTCNDFEEAVFAAHPELGRVHRKLHRSDALSVRMTGSGAALFGIFSSSEELESARTGLPVPAHSVRFVTGLQYRRMWHKQLREHLTDAAWPPRSRYGG